MVFVCRICENAEGNEEFTAREMMFGTRERFAYVRCRACGTLQIKEVPDLSAHYPENYLAFDSKVEIGATFARRWAARHAGRYLLKGEGTVGRWIIDRKPWVKEHFPESLRRPPLQLGFGAKILDLGCGKGKLLQSLYHFGFRNLTGADAFIKGDINYPNGVSIYKGGLDRFHEPFDLIMLHHSFEHMTEPRAVLSAIRRLMHEQSFCLIRMPIVAYAWERYGVNWVQMDPPRHVFLYTENGFCGLAATAGFEVDDVHYDSGAFQFWGSEMYERDIPLLHDRSPWIDPDSTLFPPEQMSAWADEAEGLNREGRGDMACFYLRRARTDQ